MKLTIILISTLVVIIIGLSLYLQPNDFGFCPMDEKPISRDGCKTVDAIVAVSGGDTAARTNHAIELYKNKWAPLLIFSGAAEDKSGPSNARAMYSIALEAGVPSKDILIEETSVNTRQNAQNTNQLLTYKNIKSVILVTSGYHQRRASLEFHKRIDSSTIAIQNSPTWDKDWSFWWWLTPRGWWLAVGEFFKIIAFYAGASE